jgi:hypothetical protein
VLCSSNLSKMRIHTFAIVLASSSILPHLSERSAYAVAPYEPPCRAQEADYQNSKKNLETCADLLSQAPADANSLHCLSELKDLNEKAKLLSRCRSESR